DSFWVAARLRLDGTFKNELVFPNSVPIPPNNQPIKLLANIVYFFNQKGQIVKEWDGFDDLGYLAQIKVIPPPNISADIAQHPLAFLASEKKDHNKALVKSYFDGLNQGNFDLIQNQFSPDLNAYDSFGKLDRTALIADWTALRSALPDLNFSL